MFTVLLKKNIPIKTKKGKQNDNFCGYSLCNFYWRSIAVNNIINKNKDIKVLQKEKTNTDLPEEKMEEEGDDSSDIMIVDIDEILNKDTQVENQEKDIDDKKSDDNIEIQGDAQEKKEEKEKIDKDVSIQVLNGSGESGVAGTVADILKTSGFKNNYNTNLIYEHSEFKLCEL